MIRKLLSKFIFLVIVLFMTNGWVSAQFTSNMPNFDNLNKSKVNEQVYLQTDCEVYAPGDTIWFKAYIRNKATLKPSGLSQVFYISLVDDKSNLLYDEKYLVINSQADGYLVINNTLEEGFYTLQCYSSWMQNFAPDKTYEKKFLILKENKENYSFVPYFNKKGYLPGDTLVFKLTCYNNLKQEIKSSKFRYRIKADDNVLQRGSGVTSETMDTPISAILTADEIKQLELNITDDNKTFDFTIPLISKIEVDFFPEGGHALIGQMNIVAFKAAYSSGLALDMAGEIVDAEGNIITAIKTDYEGMGRFLYMPDENQKYFLKITEPVGYQQLYALPTAQSNVWGLQAQTTNKVINVKITSNRVQPDTCLFMLSIRGFTHFYRLVVSEPESSFSIPTQNLPAGVGVLTLLDRKNLPQAERLVFINYRQFILPELVTEWKKYLCRDSVILNIVMDNPNQESGNYSLSVYDDVFGSSDLVDEPDIISANYLSPEIKGPIHNPNYYFSEHNNLKFYHLDLLLMTQGWRNYSYLEKSFDVDSIKFPENQDIIKGDMKRFKFGRNPEPTSGHILIYFAGSSQRISTDTNGFFSFIPEYTVNHTSSIVISGRDQKGSNGIIIHTNNGEFKSALKDYLKESFDSTFPYQKNIAYLFDDNKRQIYVDKSNSIWIEEVEIRSKKNEKYEDVEIAMIKNFSNAKKSSLSVLKASKELQEILQNMGYYCFEEGDFLQVNYRGDTFNVKFIIDGMDKGDYYPSIRDMCRPEEIKDLYVLTGLEASTVYNSNFVVYIQTDKEVYKESLYDTNTSSVTIKGLQIKKEFYSPKYETAEAKAITIPDLRKTLYWNPDVKIGTDGKTQVTFYNSDRYTRFKCVLEGITESGVPVYGEYYYEISTIRE